MKRNYNTITNVHKIWNPINSFSSTYLLRRVHLSCERGSTKTTFKPGEPKDLMKLVFRLAMVIENSMKCFIRQQIHRAFLPS